MNQIIVQVTYININKRVYIDYNSQVGLILYDLLSIFNLLIYNIEYSEFIFDDGSSIILGKTEEEHKVPLKKHIDEKKVALKQIIIHDRRRDENNNVIKDNIHIDNYVKWFDKYEETQNNRYINLINSYITNRRVPISVSISRGSTNMSGTNTQSFNNEEENNNYNENDTNESNEIAEETEEVDEIDEADEEMEEGTNNETNNEIKEDDDETKEDFFESNINYNINSLLTNNNNSSRRIHYNNLNSQRTLDNYLINVVYNELGQSSANESLNVLSSFFDNLVNNLNTQITNQENVIVCLTNEEFNLLKKDKWSSEHYKYNECIVCGDNLKEEQDIIILPCEHIYHVECIEPWLCKNSNKCPICRKEVAKGRPLL